MKYHHKIDEVMILNFLMANDAFKTAYVFFSIHFQFQN